MVMRVDPFRIAQTNQNVARTQEDLARLQQQRQYDADVNPTRKATAEANLAALQNQNKWAEEDRPGQQVTSDIKLANLVSQQDDADAVRTREIMNFAGNTARQIRSNPEQAAAIYQDSLAAAQKLGYDTSVLPPQYDENAQRIMDNMYNQTQTQQQDNSTAQQKNLKTYQDLQASGDTEGATSFGQAAGFVAEGKDSVHLQKRLSEVTDAADEAAGKSRYYDNLATEIMKAENFGGGIFASFDSMWKDATGDQDNVSSLRRSWNGVRANQAIANLPPGSASDADVALALSGFPPQNASKEHIAGFLRGMAKLEDATNKYNTFKADYISENGSEKGMLKAWRKENNVDEFEKFKTKYRKTTGSDEGAYNAWQASQDKNPNAASDEVSDEIISFDDL
jgi:hypothetical protein